MKGIYITITIDENISDETAIAAFHYALQCAEENMILEHSPYAHIIQNARENEPYIEVTDI